MNAPHRYFSGVGHMTAPEDVASCCRYGPAHPIHDVTCATCGAVHGIGYPHSVTDGGTA